ncbi:MAG: pyridoxal-phosphate dependent enzyme [Actinobacteria bacterium]|nr:MAG: pyridoxal-phosphate dependent enzyme [Actinomycetota bacterium]
MTATALELPVLADVLAARERIRKYLPQTELSSYTSLSELVGTEVWVKRENDLPTGAFKVRGGVNLVSQLTEHELRAGLIAASTGNHGQSVAYAAKLFGTQAIICVPAGANPVKVASMRSLGADVIFHGRDFDDAREHAEQLAGEHSYRYVHSGDEPHLIAGVATATIEIIEEQPQIDTIIVAVGGGSGAAGACIAGKAIRPDLNVIGVQSEAAPAAYRSWKEGRLLDDRMETFAEGIATRVGFELPQRAMRDLDDFVLVSEDAIRSATVQMIEGTRALVEPAGAAPLAGALSLRSQLAGRTVALICSGGNITLLQLRELLAPLPNER